MLPAFGEFTDSTTSNPDRTDRVEADLVCIPHRRKRVKGSLATNEVAEPGDWVDHDMVYAIGPVRSGTAAALWK